jgi:hypothetical protein
MITYLEQTKNRQTDDNAKLSKVTFVFVLLLQSHCCGTQQTDTQKKGAAAFKSDVC